MPTSYNGSETTSYTDPGNPSTWLPLAKQNRYCYGKAARLLQKLDPGAHRSTDVPTIIAGGTNGAFKMGRSIVLPKTCPPDRFYCDDQPGQNLISHNKILVSILQAFGVNENSFGSAADPALTTGTLAELKG